MERSEKTSQLWICFLSHPFLQCLPIIPGQLTSFHLCNLSCNFGLSCFHECHWMRPSCSVFSFVVALLLAVIYLNKVSPKVFLRRLIFHCNQVGASSCLYRSHCSRVWMMQQLFFIIWIFYDLKLLNFNPFCYAIACVVITKNKNKKSILIAHLTVLENKCIFFFEVCWSMCFWGSWEDLEFLY